MIAKLRELLDVAHAIVRRPDRPEAEAEDRRSIDLVLLGDSLLPPGLVPCPTCSTMQAPRDGRMAVHFADARDQRPCAGSWPARQVAA